MAKKLARKLGKLSLAILENFVESKLGEKFIEELRGDYDKAGVIVTALKETEQRFFDEFADKDLSKALFVDLAQKDYPPLKEAVGRFYDHPTDPAFPNALREVLLGEYKKILSKRQIDDAVAFYVRRLTEELALVDVTFRENARALADLRGEQSQQELVEILRRVEQLLAQQTPPPAAISVDLRNLHQIPQPPADFIDRPDELAELRAGLAGAKRASISGLTGMGGIGKTVLGLVLARELAKDYPDAHIFLDLKGTSKEPLPPAEAMRHVLHSFEPAADLRALDDAQLAAHYQDFLADKKVLLFYDNARSAAQVKPLLPPPACAALITSRWQFPIPGLKPVRLGIMKDDQAEKFLLELCPCIGDSAGELARLCGCLPLALRIAGSFLAVNEDWSLPEYLERLTKRRLQTLRSAEDAEPDLEAAFDLSYQALAEKERRNWRALAVFPTSFDRFAAAAVWNVDEPSAHDRLSCLCRYSLLDFLPSPADGSTTGALREGARGEGGRYSLHDLLRDFALVRLSGEEKKTASLRHATHYMQVLSRADDLYLKGNENILAGLSLFDREAEHIKAGQAWVTENHAELCKDYPSAGAYVLDLRLTPKQKIAWLETALSAARGLEDKASEGAHLGNLGNAYADLGDARKAIEFYEKQLVIVREIGDRRGEGNALANMGMAYKNLGDKKRAAALWLEALAIFQAIESPHVRTVQAWLDDHKK